jgi:hypothetical protein
MGETRGGALACVLKNFKLIEDRTGTALPGTIPAALHARGMAIARQAAIAIPGVRDVFQNDAHRAHQ